MKKTIKVGDVTIGGTAPVSIQSMTNTDTADTAATISQIRALAKEGCDIARLAVCNDEDMISCKKIMASAPIPLVADIQFDWKLAAACSELGFSKVRINPGNIGSDENVHKLVDVCKANSTPIRIGVNLGSLQKEISDKYGRTPEALCESALKHVALLEKFGFYDIVLSVKASDVNICTKAYRLLNDKTDYPLHLGITESGARTYGIIKSAMGIGSLLLDGIGDTVRVSLTGDPVCEVSVAKQILQALGKRSGCEIISCPTCSRCKVDLEHIYEEVSKMLVNVDKPLKVAVMGCVVNGPGEAADADLGVAGGKERSVIFSRGKIIKTVSNDKIVSELKELIDG